MEISVHLCRQLARLDSGLRLAWAGRARKASTEDNPGEFALVSLARWQDVGDIENPRIPNELWDTTTAPDSFGKAERRRIDRGTIFSRSGRPSRDWDGIGFVPVYVAKFTDYKLSNEQVASGAVLNLVKEWQRPFRERQKADIDRATSKLMGDKDALAREAHKRLWYEANKPTASGPIVPWKFAKKDVEAFYKQNKGLENYYNPYKDMRAY